MGSAETSGITADDVFVSSSRPGRNNRKLAKPLARTIRLFAEISPASLAVAGTAAAAATLFVLYDAVSATGDASSALLGSGQATAGVGGWEHGLVAFALALLAAALAFRRRADAAEPLDMRRAVEDVVATIPFGVALWNDGGQLAICNDAYLQRLAGDGPRIGPGRSYQEAVRRLTRGGHVRVVSDGDAGRILELHREDGSCLLVDDRPLASGGFVTLVTDITDRKRTDVLLGAIQEEQRQLARRYHEEKLKAEAASRAKTSFLAHLSHDIRTPLNHIIGFAELIRHQTYGPLGDGRYLGYVDTIKASGEKLLSSFAAILELAELESGNKLLREAPLAVAGLLQTVLRRFSAQASRAGIALSVGVPSRRELVADSFCLERMLG